MLRQFSKSHFGFHRASVRERLSLRGILSESRHAVVFNIKSREIKRSSFILDSHKVELPMYRVSWIDPPAKMHGYYIVCPLGRALAGPLAALFGIAVSRFTLFPLIAYNSQ